MADQLAFASQMVTWLSVTASWAATPKTVTAWCIRSGRFQGGNADRGGPNGGAPPIGVDATAERAGKARASTKLPSRSASVSTDGMIERPASEHEEGKDAPARVGADRGNDHLKDREEQECRQNGGGRIERPVAPQTSTAEERARSVPSPVHVSHPLRTKGVLAKSALCMPVDAHGVFAVHQDFWPVGGLRWSCHRAISHCTARMPRGHLACRLPPTLQNSQAVWSVARQASGSLGT